ncbi:putative nuclease HARBI1 [Eurosta solidaginis]|uniref:putative nuclease HARBI1 n=1 Tax=Eurosta solidaginis TaxID=178769 RepID=UPI0035314460
MENRRAFYVHALEEAYEETSERTIAKRTFRNRLDYFEEYTEEEFTKRFRLKKCTCMDILSRIESAITPSTNRRTNVTPKTKLLLTLRFYATGSFLITVADFCGVSVPTACRVAREVSNAIASLSKDWVKFPDPAGMQQTVFDFYKIAKFPRVIGAIDCTHVRVQSPGGENAEMFRNRKGYFSLNIQAVCDANLRFQNLVARWPGSAHDSHIFNCSRLKYQLDTGYFKDYMILGDSGYKQCRYMMTPLLNPQSAAERLYNESQIRTRNTIERTFGVWKRRFPILSMGIRVSMDTVMAIISACAVLHNIAISAKDPLPPIDIEISPSQILEEPETSFRTDGDSTARTVLISDYFARLSRPA